MSQAPRNTWKSSAKNEVQAADLKQRVDAKGGEGISVNYSKTEVTYKQQ